tara:strand:- start:2242 stop:2853 length:612 start_codon:yes stop_codon:yes gene_type:complete
MSKFYKVEGKAMYAKVFKPDTQFDRNGVYSVDLLKPEAEAVELSDFLEGMVKERVANEKKANPDVNLATHLPFAPNKDKQGNETGEIKFKFKLDAKVNGRNGEYEQKPTVVDAKRTPMSGENLIGNGSIVKVAFEPRTWVASGKCGVKLHLKALQVINLEAYAKGAETLFDDEDGYTEERIQKDDASEYSFEETATADAEGDF